MCLVSDFFFPNIGGVEKHILQLALRLQKRGFKVCIVTHSYGEEFVGEVMLPKGHENGVRVHYIHRAVIAEQVALPFILPFFFTFRKILIQEGVSIVHAHQSSSTMSHECTAIARSLGYKTVLTEHSLYESSEVFSFDNLVNTFLRISLCHVDHVICVSEKCRENLVQRTKLIAPPEVTTIPNAINAWEFVPDYSKRSPGYPSINVVLMSRLVPRKGVDLLVEVIPALCAKYSQVRVIIGGDGPRRGQIESMVREHCLESRVELLGAVASEGVRDVLVRGHIFLNCSLTESFCISLMEAASCGLKVVSTNVGGVPEVLPPDMTELCEPCVEDITRGLSRCIDTTMKEEEAVEKEVQMRENRAGGVSRAVVERERGQHERVKRLRSWMDVAEQTEAVYSAIIAEDRKKGGYLPLSIPASSWSRLRTKLLRYSHLRWHEYIIGAGLAVILEVAGWFVSSSSSSNY